MANMSTPAYQGKPLSPGPNQSSQGKETTIRSNALDLPMNKPDMPTNPTSPDPTVPNTVPATDVIASGSPVKKTGRAPNVG